MFEFFPDSVLELIAHGESTTVEFKSKVPSFNILTRILTAFANTNGGVLIIGIQDDGNISGLTRSEAFFAEKELLEVGQKLFPHPYSLQIGTLDVDNKILVYGYARKAPDYIYPIMTSRGDYYQRVDDKIVKNPASHLRDNIQEKVEVTKRPDNNIIVFVAMSFREEEEPSLVDYFRAMERAVKTTKLPIELHRMDLLDGDFEISQKIMDEIYTSDIVIADFTLSSRNVYFELGYARGLKRRVIQTARKDTVLEFDIRNWKTIIYRNATELEEKLIGELLAAYFEVVTGNGK